ncbi:ArsR/SmtB family transcription factor [Crateriforma conspicua]|uniref:Putative HTH-type transcriptional regulator n=1 Tax=Crateriforma conspicua TaxID=2527996 RepID=A0A5C5YBN9_9PLAN|nr:metalloregulator ArsR/SmtB family transcription factor [Crateriforma conspicua]QDV61550.1 putative HTH-type transcriptional regulator [Crateriforma conspicua]TWT72203.1 putative HTH-type transcriptional regulator [Crateriforma conspicua]
MTTRTAKPKTGQAKAGAAKNAKPKNSGKPKGSVEMLTEAAECLKTLAHPVRLRIVQLLLHGRFTVGELAADCQIPDNVASEHLRLLQRCGFLTSQREGRRVYYQVAEPHLEQLMACIEGRFIR